jgi:hypothetical protein
LGLKECLIFGRNHAPAGDGSADRAGYDLAVLGVGVGRLVPGYDYTVVRMYLLTAIHDDQQWGCRRATARERLAGRVPHPPNCPS